MVIHTGKCHCGAIRFEVEAPEVIDAIECNCSICELTGYLHLIVPVSRFRLIEGDEFITKYTFNTHTAEHMFCKICGIKPFYIPRSNPDGFDINVRCLDKDRIRNIHIEKFDGKNWEENARDLSHLSKD